MCVCVCCRPDQLIDLIVNRDYWEIIYVETIIVMSVGATVVYNKKNISVIMYLSRLCGKCTR